MVTRWLTKARSGWPVATGAGATGLEVGAESRGATVPVGAGSGELEGSGITATALGTGGSGGGKTAIALGTGGVEAGALGGWVEAAAGWPGLAGSRRTCPMRMWLEFLIWLIFMSSATVKPWRAAIAPSDSPRRTVWVAAAGCPVATAAPSRARIKSRGADMTLHVYDRVAPAIKGKVGPALKRHRGRPVDACRKSG